MRKLATVAVAMVLVCAGAAASRAAAPATGGTPHITTGKTLRFDVRFSPFFLVDLGQKGPSKGDEIVFHDRLLTNGAQAGYEGGSCVLFSAAEANCTGTIKLSQGQITFQFLNAPPPVKHFAVTGGTGWFANVRGQGTLVEFGNGSGSMTLELIP